MIFRRETLPRGAWAEQNYRHSRTPWDLFLSSAQYWFCSFNQFQFAPPRCAAQQHKPPGFSSGELLHRLLAPVQPRAEQSVPGFLALVFVFPSWLYRNELFKGTTSCFLLRWKTKNCPEILSSPFEFLHFPPSKCCKLL